MVKTILWFCGRGKFDEITSAGSDYRKTLGHAYNYEWTLNFQLGHIRECPTLEALENEGQSQDEEDVEAFNCLWDFSLSRDRNGTTMNVTARIICGNFIINRNLNFRNDMRALHIGTCDVNEVGINIINAIFIFESGYSDEITDDVENGIKCENGSQESERSSVATIESPDNRSMGHMPDFTFKCGPIEIQVCKLIMSIRSPGFPDSFRKRKDSEGQSVRIVQEAENNEIVIDDLDPSVFCSMIAFLNQGQVDIDSLFMAKGLLYADKKYLITGLKEAAINYLMSALSGANAVYILELADMYDEGLRKRTIRFIRSNLNDIANSYPWKCFEDTKLEFGQEVINLSATNSQNILIQTKYENC